MADGPQDAPRHAGQVVRRVLLRRNIAVDAETAQLVADAVQAALQPAAPSRPPRRRPRGPAADSEPLFRLRTPVMPTLRAATTFRIGLIMERGLKRQRISPGSGYTGPRRWDGR